uniref:CSON013811 protein n=1 Tax=Culicoides sonorensis TaxID=179676 RepID=A0A336MD76_CULSO
MDDKAVVRHSVVIPELYFLISKFLSNGPLKKTAKVLAEELEQFMILPRRLDWTGQEHEQSFEELESKYSHIGPQHLLEICARIGPILDKELAPSVTGVISLLGAGRQSLLRTKESVSQPRSLIDHCTRLHGAPLYDAINRKSQHNIIKVLYGRQYSGPITRRLAIPPSFYNKLSLIRTTLGHLTAVYCVLFDRSGKYIITGADDLLVKLWSAIDGRLLATFRGASAEITDITVNLENTLLAAGSLDRILRVWDLQTCAPIAVLTAHTGMITSVNFCPSPRGDLRYLVTTSTDGSIAFWQYTTPRGGKTVFASKPIQYLEKLRPGQAKMICASFSSGGLFLAAGSADNHVRVYMMSEDGPKRILEIESHLDTVDSIQWSHSGLRFVSGSKDGTAQIWHFETQQWKNTKLNMSERLPGAPPPEDENKKFKVTMVAWDLSDRWIITAVSDHTIKVWNSATCKLHKVLEGHTDEVYVLEAHPKDAHICLSAGHDGQLFVWDVFEGVILCKFKNIVEHQMHGGIYDAKWSPDGLMVAATDSHGHILMFGFGSGHERLKILPKELFFHTDYRPLIRDSNFYVMDEQTQTAPHLMPPPFLVDIDGNPHDPKLQTLVPGRENCPADQLIPNLETIESPENQARSDIDRLIEALANRQGNQENQNQPANVSAESSSSQNRTRSSLNRSMSRRSGEVEPAPAPTTPRPSTSSFANRSTTSEQQNTFKYVRRTYVRTMNYANLQHLRQTVYHAGVLEQELHRREMRKRPLMINTSNAGSANAIGRGRTRGRGARNANPPAYRTRNTRAREPLPEDDEQELQSSSSSTSSDDSTAIEDMDLSEDTSTSDSESSDYSDWVANEPGPANLQPPKRSKRKPVERRTYSPTNNEPSTSAQAESSSHENNRGRRKKLPIPANGGEIPEIYRPPEWLSEVIPRKAPYYPQMGDEVIYLREGHQKYLDAVRSKKVYDPGNRCEPWSVMDLQAHELCKVIGIKYEIKPPRLCCLKLGVMEEDGHLTGQSFTIKYHDMADVLDFLVLRQTFETAVSRHWSVGDRFRCMIGDSWWMGQIDSLNRSSEFPDSHFLCFKVRWDNGEFEYMSPWDLEPVDENRLPTEVGGEVPLLPEELNATLYQPTAEEWPHGGRDETCQRIIKGLEQVIGLAIADPFLVPVDLSLYPAYAFVVEYPIDLTTIKARFENRFYRRITSAQFDVRYLATNAEKFNQSHSNIVKHARIITELCLRILTDPYPTNVPSVYHQLVDSYVSSESDADNEPQPGPSRPTGSRRSRRLVPDGDWRAECRELLEMIWQCEDSEPFREPVDTLEHPDYLQVIESPMDLRTIKEDLLGENYETPLTFAKDMRLIFHNSRSYNTNKRSRIYSMTLRLSTLFEAHIKSIIYNWKSAKRRTKNGNLRKQAAAAKKAPTQRRTRRRRNNIDPNEPGTSTQHNNDHDDHDEDTEMEVDPLDISDSVPNTRRRRGTRGLNGRSGQIRDPQPGPSRRTRMTRHSQEEDEDDSESDSSESSEDESSGSPPKEFSNSGRPMRKVRKDKEENGIDSGDSYNPYRPMSSKRKAKKKGGKRKRNMTKSSATSTPVKRKTRKIANSSEDDAENNDDDSADDNISAFADGQASEQSSDSAESSDDNKPIGRTRRGKAAAAQINSSEHSDIDRRRTRRTKRYESDQSYHADAPKTRKAFVEDSESDHEGLRTTRGSTRRAQQAWGQATDSLEDDEPPRQSQRRLRTRKATSESEHSPEETSISKRVISNRNTRASRRNEPELEQPSTSSGRSTRTRQGTSTQPTLSTSISPFMDAPRSETNTENLTRSGRRMMPLRSQVGFSNAQQQQRAILPHEVDHNYGEPRRPPVPQLSRHQRSVDELENQDESESLSSRLRHRTLVNNSLRTSTRTTRHSQTTNTDQNSDSDEDNTPLNRLQSGTNGGLAGSSSSSRPQRNTRRNRVHDSDDDHHDQPGPSSGRSTRKQKRPHYNEDTDEETVKDQRPRKRQAVAPSESENDEEVSIQVSSRGRIRRIKPQARGLFKE